MPRNHTQVVRVECADRAAAPRKIPGKRRERTFHAQIDTAPDGNGHDKEWFRIWDSPSPDVLTIRDEYELAKGDAVEFYWQTNLPVEQTDSVVTIRGDRGLVTLSIPPDCTVRIDRLPLAEGAEHTRIAIHKPAPSGTMETIVHLHSE